MQALGVAVPVSTPEDAIAGTNSGSVDALPLASNLAHREPERSGFPLARGRNVSIIVRTPMAFGLPTGKYRVGHRFASGDFRGKMPADWLETNIPKVERLRVLVKGRVKGLPRAAIAFVLSQDAVSVTIPGAKTVRHGDENVSAAEVAPLDPEELRRVGDVPSARSVYGGRHGHARGTGRCPSP